jgi:hypothetical protein
MSEYQYYEFQAIDRRLIEREMQELRFYSTRAQITPTSFINVYHFGSFKGNAETWKQVDQLIDARQSKSYGLAVQHLVDLRGFHHP